ncbi:hypothetical protein GCM10017562_64680 [Streptomyces roseofulvus]|uniref:Uncharacterized protein n=2 Tax=Streptomyces TaxID=1883 RepID=A0ABU4K8Y0_9ACTN|nr:hypothetical protein [Streptomyces roseolus]MDX2294213.1 hypothetical protein [Streptomyces roseolus]
MTTPHPGYDSTRHPDLLAWLAERQVAFGDWAREAGGDADRFDFSDASLDALEERVRETFAAPEEITARRRSPFVQGAVWYIGETLRRRREGWVWKFEPDVDFGLLPAFYPAVPDPAYLDTPCVGAPGAEPGEHWYPLNTLRRLLVTEDEFDNPVDEGLVGMIEGWYEEEEEEDE